MPLLADLIRRGLFNPLSAQAQGAAVYAQMLLALFHETGRHHQPLSRELVLDVLTQALAEPEALAQVAADPLEDGADSEAAPAELRPRAAAVLRYFERSGWLVPEMQADYSVLYTLPEHAFRLLETLHELEAGERLPLPGLVYTIHDLVQGALRDGNLEDRLPVAYQHTRHSSRSSRPSSIISTSISTACWSRPRRARSSPRSLARIASRSSSAPTMRCVRPTTSRVFGPGSSRRSLSLRAGTRSARPPGAWSRGARPKAWPPPKRNSRSRPGCCTTCSTRATPCSAP